MKTFQWYMTESVFNSDIFSLTKRQKLSKTIRRHIRCEVRGWGEAIAKLLERGGG